MNKSIVRISLAICAIAIIGCEESEDQTKTPPNALPIVNPKPVERDFRGNNARHRVIMAVIDSGTDYNHPRLLDNIHFELDESGVPVGAGYDFTGEDKWPAPYIARTAHLHEIIRESDLKDSNLIEANARTVITKHPELELYLNPARQLYQESDGSAYHGTHVGGLMAYDEPQIGLLIYRVLPLNITYEKLKGDYIVQKRGDKKALVYTNIRKAIEMAVKSGARVVNLSLGLVTKSDDSKASEDELKRHHEWRNELSALMRANPNVVFVAAAGNENAWIDDESSLQLPCGADAKNLVCVGALNAKDRLASFSNVLMTDGYYLAAPGVDILSLFPSAMCDSRWVTSLKYESFSENYQKYLFDDCVKSTGLKKATGTSMASPIAARVIAKILIQSPQLSGEEAIRELIRTSESFKVGRVPMNRLRVDRPSWYPAETEKPSSLLNPASLCRGCEKSSGKHGYFELFAPYQQEI